MKHLQITLVRSTIGAIPKHKLTVKALGLGRPGSVVKQKDNPAIRGMIKKIRHLVSVQEIPGQVDN